MGPFDRGLLVTYETAADLAVACRGRVGGGLAYDPGRVSALLILLADGTTPERVRFAVAQRPGLKVVSGGSLVTSIRQGASSLLGGVLVLALVFLLIAVMLVGLLYSAIVAERSREIGLLMALGSRGRHVVQMFLAEASVTTALGGLLGVVVGAGLLLAFRRSVGYALRDGPGPIRLAAAGDDRRDRRRLRAALSGDRPAGCGCPRLASRPARTV